MQYFSHENSISIRSLFITLLYFRNIIDAMRKRKKRSRSSGRNGRLSENNLEGAGANPDAGERFCLLKNRKDFHQTTLWMVFLNQPLDVDALVVYRVRIVSALEGCHHAPVAYKRLWLVQLRLHLYLRIHPVPLLQT